jgi:pimeloyl-ACP methyl ester carboxylesterase
MLVVAGGIVHRQRRYSPRTRRSDEDAPMRSVPSFDGLALAVHDHGGVGTPTLLCHATGLHGAVWEPLSAALGDGFERWAVDFRGHGASVVPPGDPLPWSAMAEDVLAVVDALALEPGRALGVGHSMGGAALLLAEQARPGTFAGLWMFEPIAPPTGALGTDPGGNPLAEGALRRRRTFASIAEAVNNFAAKPPLNMARADALHAYVRHGFVAGEDGAVHIACRPEDESQVYRGAPAHGAFDHLGEVPCPVVVACGGEPFGPAAFASAIADALPDGCLERHEHLGHFGPLEAPAELAASIRAFAATI